LHDGPAQPKHHQIQAEVERERKQELPIAPAKHPPSEQGTDARRTTRYKVHKGDTVQSVADNFGVPPVMVRRWNHLKGESVQGRRVLYVHLPVTPNGSDAIRASSPKSQSSNRLRRTAKTPTRHK